MILEYQFTCGHYHHHFIHVYDRKVCPDCFESSSVTPYMSTQNKAIVRTIVLPDAKRYMKALFPCTDTTITSTFTANMVYLAR